MTRRRADVLGLVCTVNPFVEMAHHPFELELLSALFYHALERGYNPMIYGLPADDAEGTLRRYVDGRSDAFVLLYPPPDSALLCYLHAQGVPVVALCSSYPESPTRWVDSDHAQGIRAAVAHLAALGHRRIAYLTAPSADIMAHTRVRAFCAALEEHGLPVCSEWIIPYAWESAVAETLIAPLLAGDEPPTALLIWNDFAAEGVYKAIRRLGFRIPEDVSIIGFDDTPSARAAVPPLTTVRQDIVRMARAAVDLAIEALSTEAMPEPPPYVLCPVELIIRQSTAPPVSHRHRREMRDI